jgi:hypothetical protein
MIRDIPVLAESPDAEMLAGLQCLPVSDQFFVEPFARPQPGDFDVHVFADPVARKRYHVSRQIHDFNGRPHVENEHLASARQYAALEHEGHGFVGRHEVPGYVRVSYSDRAAGFYLPAEDRHHAAVAAEHVPEAYG